MRVRSMFVTVIVGVLLLANEALAQVPSCGQVSIQNDIYQAGASRYVFVQANTTREITPCALDLQTEAWVVGVGSATQKRGLYSAPLMIGTPVPNYGTWHSQASTG